MDLAEYKGIYVIAEQFEGKLRDVSFELLGQARILADTIGDEVGAILIGKDVKPLAQELIAHGAHKVYVYDDPQLEHYNTTALQKLFAISSMKKNRTYSSLALRTSAVTSARVSLTP